MASSSPWKANPVSPELETLIKEARDPNTLYDQLEELLDHPEAEVRRALLDNPNVCYVDGDGRLDAYLLGGLAKEFPEEVATHHLFVLHALIEPNEEMIGVVKEVAQRTVDVGLIEQLWRTWRHFHFSVLRAVARNPKTPVDLLRILANKSTEPQSSIVRTTVAENPSTPVDVLRLLGNEKTEVDLLVRRAVAENPRTPEDTLRLLGNEATESQRWVREAAQKALAARGLS